MKKLIVLFIASFFMFNMGFAQKIKLMNGDLKFLNDLSELSITFEYPDDIRIGKMSQQDYIDKKVKEADTKEAGSGEKWKEQFFADRNMHYEPMFMELFEKYSDDLLIEQDNSKYGYMMIVETIFIEPGFNIGIQSKKAAVDFEVRFVETGNENNILATLSVMKSPGTAHYDQGLRVGESYAKGAKELGKFLVKKGL